MIAPTRTPVLALAALLSFALHARAQPAATGAGTVKGVVTDESGAPLAGVAITLEALGGVSQSVTTGARGDYAFAGLEPGPYRVTAALAGFGRQAEHVVVEAGAPEVASFSLRVLALDQLVASAAHKAKTVREAPATVYVVTEAMIRERGYNYLFDALQDAPGLDIVWMNGLYGPIIMPRGLDSQENNRLVLMVDGIVDNNLAAGTSQVYMQYSLHNVKRVEIIYGPASALYGANAMAGLINIITKTGEDLKGIRVQGGGMLWDPHGRRTGMLGNLNAGNVWGEAGHKIDVAGSFHVIDTDGSDLRLHADEARSDNPANPGASNYYFSKDHIGEAEKGTYLAQARASFEHVGLTVGGHVWWHGGGQGTYGHEGAVFLNGFQNQPDVWNFRNRTGFANWSRKLGQATNTLGAVYRTTDLADGFDAYFNTTGSGPDGKGTPPTSGSRYYRPDTSLKLDDNVAIDLGAKMTLTAGVTAEFQHVSDYQLCPGANCPAGTPSTAGLVFDHQTLISTGPFPVLNEKQRYHYRDLSGYAEHAWSVTDTLSLTTGLRFDAFRLTGDETPQFFGTRDTDANGVCLPGRTGCVTAAQAAAAGAVEISRVYYQRVPYNKTRYAVNPRVGVVYSLHEKKLTLKGLYGEGFRMPTVRELFSVSGSRFDNPDLEAEKIRTAEISGTYQLPNERGLVELDTFHTKANSIITLTPGSVLRPGRTTFLNQFQNVAEPRIYGFDLKGQVRASRVVDLFGHYSFQVPEYLKIDAGNHAHDPDTADTKDFTDRIPRQAEHKGMVGASISVWRRHLVMSPRLVFVGSRPDVITDPMQDVPAYTSFNVSFLARDIVRSGLSAQVVAYNVGNADILDPGFRTGNKANDFPAAHPQPGLHFFFKVGYQKSF